MLNSGVIIYCESNGDYLNGSLTLIDGGDYFNPSASTTHTIEYRTENRNHRVDYSQSNDTLRENAEGGYFLNILKIEDEIKIQGINIDNNIGHESLLTTFKPDGDAEVVFSDGVMQKTYLSIPHYTTSVYGLNHITFDAHNPMSKPQGFTSSGQARAAYSNYYSKVTSYNYTMGFTINGLPNIDYDISDIHGSASDKIIVENQEITRKVLIINMDNMHIDEVRQNDHFYYDYKLVVDGQVLHEPSGSRPVPVDGISDYGIMSNTTNEITGRSYWINTNTFNLRNNEWPKLSFDIEYTVYICASATNEVLDSRTTNFTYNMVNYGNVFKNEIVDKATNNRYDGYFGDYNKLDLKFNANDVNPYRHKFTYKTTLEDVDNADNKIILINKRGNYGVSGRWGSTWNNINNTGRRYRVITYIEDCVNSYEVRGNYVCNIDKAYWDITNVNVKLSGNNTSGDPVEFDYIITDSTGQRSESPLPSDIKFFSDGTVTANAKFTLNTQRHMLEGNSDIIYNQRPSGVYLIAVKKTDDYDNLSNINRIFDNRGNVDVTSSRNENELEHFSNVNSLYGEYLLSQRNQSGIYYSYQEFTPETLPDKFLDYDYDLSVQLDEYGSYSFYVVAANEFVGHLSHCLTNTQTPSTYDSAQFDIPWRQ